MRTFMIALAMGFLATGNASAQAYWDSPSFMSPQSHNDLGVYYIDADELDWGLQGIWRQTGNLNLGVRGGLGETVAGQTSITVGAEFFGGLNRAGPSFPLDVSWTLGAGASFVDDVVLFSVPLGLSVGARLSAGQLALTPYVHPRLSVDVFANDDFSETDLSIPVDLGVDIALGQRAIFRVGATLGDRGHEALGIGLALRMQRGIAVR